jgi:hypothetical protein
MWKMALAILACATIGTAAQADEEKIDLDKLPAKVTAAVKEKFKGAELISASKEKEDNKVLFEVRLKPSVTAVIGSSKKSRPVSSGMRKIAADSLVTG